jgi:hypothetical protein
MGSGKALVLRVMFLCAVAARPAAGESSIVLPKPGQVGIEAGGGYGMLLKSGPLGDLYDAGPTFVVRGRYRMRYERALGLTFESQRMDVREAAPVYDGSDSTVAPTRISLITSGIEFYQMFGTRTRTTRMLMVGAGLAQARAKLNSGETQLVEVPGDIPTGAGDGLYVSGGAGVERFFYRSWAFDLSARYMAIFREGKASHDLQAALGVIFYASY